ncbi:unnamed protein product [Polarella glacialis]|uniref:Uncharacterized protein n=1 Tax=Polarella glacialis TaxID=89957 RepID=A0A813FAN3_POLGL|nr:unnamed protein product [Polarella glacialis]CAE8731629.1 unnamed protein product [Polarella glacialis]
MPQQISELAHATSPLVGRVASAFRVVPPPTVIRDVTQHAISAVLFKTRLKPRYLGATSEATAVNAIAANHILLWQASAARPTTGPPAMLPIQPMPGAASPLPVMPPPVPPSPPRPKPQAPGGVPPPVQALNFSQVFTKLRSSVLTLMLTAIGSLMLLVMQYYPLGLALLGFTAALLHEKLTSMGMMFVSVATALGSGVASAAIDAQWNTVLFWSVCLTFVGLLVLGKQLSDYVRGVKPDEPLLPSWLIQQQQLFAQLPQESSPPPLPPPYEPPFEGGYEEECEGPPELQQNLFAFASGTAPLGPVSNTFAGQTGWLREASRPHRSSQLTGSLSPCGCSPVQVCSLVPQAPSLV